MGKHKSAESEKAERLHEAYRVLGALEKQNRELEDDPKELATLYLIASSCITRVLTRPEMASEMARELGITEQALHHDLWRTLLFMSPDARRHACGLEPRSVRILKDE